MSKTQMVDGAELPVGESLRMCLGGKVSLKLKSNEGSLTDVRWTVGGWGNTVSSYELTDDKATVNPFASYSGTSIAFYWVKTGTFTIAVQGRVKGQFFQHSTKVKVSGPNVVRFRGETDEVKIASIAPPTGVGNDVTALTFGGDRVSNRPGMYSTAELVAPECPGKVTIVQVMTISRTMTKDSGATDIKTSDDKYVLDEDVFYGFTEDGDDDDDVKNTVSCAGGTTVKIHHEDSPASVLSRAQFRGEVLKSTQVHEAFRTYLMYKPKGGVWVAVAKLEWFWRGTATWSTAKNQWELSGADWSRNPSGSIVIEQPMWAKNRYSIM